MPIGNITQSVSVIPAPPHRGVDVQTVFVTKQEDFQDHLAGTTIEELNTLKDQLNTRIGEINSTTTTMNGYADTASAGASTATTKAGEASTSASEALTSKNQAETFKNNASTSATKASQWADNAYNVEVETGKYSAKHWSTVAQNASANKIDKVTSTDNAIVRFNGTTGDVQNSGIRIDDAGNILIDKPLGGVTTVSMTNGAGNTNLILPESGIVATTADINSISLSGVTAYHLLSGNLSVDATVLTNGFGLYLYTGNTTTLPTINLGMDIASQWGNTADETYGYLIKFKSRSAAGDWTWVNSVRGITKYISSNTAAVEGTDANMFTLSTVAGVTTLNIGTSTRTNTNGVTYEIEVYQTTHRKTGVTNQGKAFTEHYNYDTGFTIEGYEGSGLALHEIPHSLGRELGFRLVKNLSAVNNWITEYDNNGFLVLNLTDAYSTSYKNSSDSNKYTINSSVANWNASTNQYIMFGYRNSYFDESGKLIGNFEIGVYQGTGVTGNKVTTRGKLASITHKVTSTTGGWSVEDNIRGDNYLYINLNNVEGALDVVDFVSDGFVLKETTGQNISGGQYLYFGVYDNDSGSGKSKYPKATDIANVQINNGIIPLANGIDSNGSKNSIVAANETITGVTYTAGKNYLYKTNTGYGVKNIKPSYGKINPASGGDFYNILENKWYTSAGLEITESRNYMNHIVHADADGGVLYVEELPKIEYKNIIKAEKYLGSNAISLSVAFDLTTTPITIKGKMIGAKALIRTGSGIADIYLNDDLKGTELKLDGISNGNQVRVLAIADNKITIETSNSSGTATSYTYTSINGVGE